MAIVSAGRTLGQNVRKFEDHMRHRSATRDERKIGAAEVSHHHLLT